MVKQFASSIFNSALRSASRPDFKSHTRNRSQVADNLLGAVGFFFGLATILTENFLFRSTDPNAKAVTQARTPELQQPRIRQAVREDADARRRAREAERVHGRDASRSFAKIRPGPGLLGPYVGLGFMSFVHNGKLASVILRAQVMSVTPLMAAPHPSPPFAFFLILRLSTQAYLYSRDRAAAAWGACACVLRSAGLVPGAPPAETAKTLTPAFLPGGPGGVHPARRRVLSRC